MKNIIISLLVSLFVSTLLISGYHFVFTAKIGYVRTGEIIQKYKGMIAANKQFEEEMNQPKGKIDSKEWGYKIGIAENEYMQYEQSAREQLEKRRQELLNSILDGINNRIKKYGGDHNYTLVLGATKDGSILHGKKNDDRTEEILEILNSEYEQQKMKEKK
jgi:Skp family chaperone for outer membrane proteins